jgi:hypothetical protein
MDVLAYWTDYSAGSSAEISATGTLRWHSSARSIETTSPGDRLWIVTSGRRLSEHRKSTPQAAFLVGVWNVREVVRNPGDDPAYSARRAKYRVIADASASIMLQPPVFVDHVIRPRGADKGISIGKFLYGAQTAQCACCGRRRVLSWR